MDDDRRVAFCPHCGNRSTHRVVFNFCTQEPLYDDSDQEIGTDDPCTYFLATCETCKLALLYYFDDNLLFWNPDASHFQNAAMLWPRIVTLTEAVPEPIRRCYREAVRIRQVAPTAFAVQIRRALEALCDDRGAVKGTLQRRLEDLAFRNEIPPVLAEMSEMLRVLGNIGAHDHQHQISISDTRIIDDFFRSIIEYVYEAPKRIRDFRSELVKFGKQPSAAEAEPGASESSEKAKRPVN